MINERFKNQVAVISGGAEGLGKAIALRLASEGAKLVIVDFNREKLAETVEALAMEGHEVMGEAVDVSNEDEVSDGFKRAMERFGRIDVMVNSAGIVGPTS